MKGLFVLQRRFAIIGHEIAKAFNEKYGPAEFCGYVYLRSSFEYLKAQTDVAYTRLLLDEDIHERYRNEKLDLTFLRRLETDYGIPNLWQYLTNDRITMYGQHVREYPHHISPYTHEEMLRILQVKAKAILEIFDTEQPDFVSISVIASVGSQLIYEIAKKRGIKIIIGDIARIGDYYHLSEEWRSNTWVDALFKELQAGIRTSPLAGKANEYLERFQNKPMVYFDDLSVSKQLTNRRRQLGFLKPLNLWRSASWLYRMSAAYIRNPHKDDYEEIKPWFFAYDLMRRKLRTVRGFDDLWEKPVSGAEYAFFPLQYEPENALTLFAPFFADQAYVIRQIARSLPVGYKLYVKEHPQMVGFRPRAYYEELRTIPNVLLLHPNIESFKLIERAKLVTTITSTVGWEAVLLKKPVITFGNVFYNVISSVRLCKTIEDLPFIVQERLTNFTYDHREIQNYLAALFEDSVEVPILSVWINEIDNNEKLRSIGSAVADLLADKLGLGPRT